VLETLPVMDELRFRSDRILWFVLGDSVLAIGAAFLLGSFFLLSSGNGKYGNQAGPVGLVLMVLGGATALASILAGRSNPASSASTQSRIH